MANPVRVTAPIGIKLSAEQKTTNTLNNDGDTATVCVQTNERVCTQL